MNKRTAAGANQTPDTEVAERILKALGNKKLSQEALAQEIGISHTTLRRGLEQHRGDRRSFTILELGRIAAALSTHPSSLLPAELIAHQDAA